MLFRFEFKRRLVVVMDSVARIHPVDPSSFQSSRTGFTSDVSSVQGHCIGTPVTTRGYQTPKENVQACGTCGKGFTTRHTYKRHIQTFRVKKNLGKRRKLSFHSDSGSGKKRKGQDLFDECSSTSSGGEQNGVQDEDAINDIDDDGMFLLSRRLVYKIFQLSLVLMFL